MPRTTTLTHPAALAAALLAALLTACDANPASDADAVATPDAAADPDAALDPDAADPAPCRAGPARVDLLIVIDDSGSMCEEQAELAAALAAASQHLAAADSDHRVAVVTTDMNAHNPNRGRFVADPALPVPSLNCIDATTGEADIPDTADCQALIAAGQLAPVLDPTGLDAAAIATRLRCMVTVGTQGDGFEQGLAAARLALACDGPNAASLATCCADPLDCDRPFLRPDAALAVLIVADEDDCSDTPDAAPCDTGSTPGACAVPRHENSACAWNADRLIPPADIAAALRAAHPTAPAYAAATLVGPAFAPIDGNPIRFVPGAPAPGCAPDDAGRIPVDATCCPGGACAAEVQPVCEGPRGAAFAGDRYRAFAAAFGPAPCAAPDCGSICAEDPTGPLDRLLSHAEAALPPPCD